MVILEARLPTQRRLRFEPRFKKIGDWNKSWRARAYFIFFNIFGVALFRFEAKGVFLVGFSYGLLLMAYPKPIEASILGIEP